jgi:hypothetical protein
MLTVAVSMRLFSPSSSILPGTDPRRCPQAAKTRLPRLREKEGALAPPSTLVVAPSV